MEAPCGGAEFPAERWSRAASKSLGVPDVDEDTNDGATRALLPPATQGLEGLLGELTLLTYLQELDHVQLGVSFLLLRWSLAEQLCGIHLIPLVVLSCKPHPRRH